MKRSSFIEGGVKLRMSVPMTKGISDNIGITRDAKCVQLKIIKRCIKPQVTQTRLVLRLSVRTKIRELRSSSDHNLVLTVMANISGKAIEREVGSMHLEKGSGRNDRKRNHQYQAGISTKIMIANRPRRGMQQ